MLCARPFMKGSTWQTQNKPHRVSPALLGAPCPMEVSAHFSEALRPLLWLKVERGNKQAKPWKRRLRKRFAVERPVRQPKRWRHRWFPSQTKSGKALENCPDWAGHLKALSLVAFWAGFAPSAVQIVRQVCFCAIATDTSSTRGSCPA